MPPHFHVTGSSTCLHESKISQQYLIDCRKTCSPYSSILFSSRLSECFSNLCLFLTLYPFIAVLSSCSPHLTLKLLRGSLSNLRQVDIQTFAQPHLETALSPADFQEVFTLHDSLTCRILQASQAREYAAGEVNGRGRGGGEGRISTDREMMGWIQEAEGAFEE